MLNVNIIDLQITWFFIWIKNDLDLVQPYRKTEVQPYRKTDYKPIIYIYFLTFSNSLF